MLAVLGGAPVFLFLLLLFLRFVPYRGIRQNEQAWDDHPRAGQGRQILDRARPLGET